MIGSVGGVNPASASSPGPPPTQAQYQELQQYINNLWALTYGSDEQGKGNPDVPSSAQLAMIAQSISALNAYIASIQPVTLDQGTQNLLNDISAGNPSIASLATTFAQNPTNAADLASFADAYNQNAPQTAMDIHDWYGINSGISYTPNTTPSGATALSDFTQFQSDATDFLTYLQNYNSNPDSTNLSNLESAINALNKDFGSTTPPNLDPYETAIYQMINTPQEGASGSTLVQLAAANNTSGIADFLGDINSQQSNGGYFQNIMNAIINGDSGEWSPPS